MSDRPPVDPRRLRPLTPGLLSAWAVVGLVLGWLARRVFEALGSPVPLVTWPQALVLFFVAGVLATVAWITWRSVRDRRHELEAHHMVNRLVLARACALVGALLAGAYVGLALSWVGVESELRSERIVRAVVAAGGAVSMVVSSVLLERACRVRPDEDKP